MPGVDAGDYPDVPAHERCRNVLMTDEDAQRFDELIKDVCSLMGCRPEHIQSIEYRPSDRQVNVILEPLSDHVEIKIVKAEPEPRIPSTAALRIEDVHLRNQGRTRCVACGRELPTHRRDCPAMAYERA